MTSICGDLRHFSSLVVAVLALRHFSPSALLHIRRARHISVQKCWNGLRRQWFKLCAFTFDEIGPTARALMSSFGRYNVTSAFDLTLGEFLPMKVRFISC